MPKTLATIPEIVVGSIVQGDVVLRNVVVAPKGYTTDSGGGLYTQPIDMVTPWKPPTDGGIRQQPIQPAKQFDENLNPNNFAKLPPDTRVIFIDGDEVINASREEAPDFLNNGAYFIGAFAPEAAQAVVDDMIRNPIPSPEESIAKNVAEVMKLQAGVGLSILTFINAYLDADEAWQDFEGIDDDETLVLMTPPVSGVEVPKNFPAEREIRIQFAPDYGVNDVWGDHTKILNSVLSRSPKAVLDQSRISRTTPRGGDAVAFTTFIVWVPDSVTDLQVLEGIRREMNANVNVLIATKRLTGVDVGVKAPVDPVQVIPEENKAVVADKYAALLNEMQSIAMCVTRYNNGTEISRPCAPGEKPLPQYTTPRYQALEQQAQVIAQQGGAPAGCQPVSPQTLPPSLVPQACLKPKPPPPPRPPPVKLPPAPPAPPSPPRPPGTNSGGTGNPGGK